MRTVHLIVLQGRSRVGEVSACGEHGFYSVLHSRPCFQALHGVPGTTDQVATAIRCTMLPL